MGRMAKKYTLDDTPSTTLVNLKNRKCEWCNQPLSRKPVIHHNKFHDPEEHAFCSRECHNAWCYQQDKAKGI